MKVVKIKQTKKNIYIDRKFVSYPKSLLATAIFAIKNRVDELEVVDAAIDGYKSVTLKGKALNLGIDFTFVGAVLKKLNETTDDVVYLTFNELYKDVDYTGSNPQNNNKVFAKRLDESAERIASLKLRIEDNLGRIYHGGLFSLFIDPNKKVIEVTANGIVRDLFQLDCNAIFNVNFEIYNSLKKEYAKKLYLFYLTHNVGEENQLSVEMMKDRLLCNDMEDKEFNRSVVEANEELIEKGQGFLVSAKKGYDSHDKRTVKRFIVKLDPKLNRNARRDINKEEEAKKETEVVKAKAEVKAEINRVEKPKTAATIELERSKELMKEMFKDIKVNEEKEIDKDDPTTWF